MTRAYRTSVLVGIAAAVAGAGYAGGRPAVPQPAHAEDRDDLTVVRDTTLRPLRRDDHMAVSTGPLPAGNAVTIAGQRLAHRVMAVTALPGETLLVQVDAAAARSIELRYAQGSARVRPPMGWQWVAPAEPGVYALRLSGPSLSPYHVNVLVMHPRAHVHDGQLHGYRIGEYRDRPLRGNPIYVPPSGFVEVGAAEHDVLVSPHFVLGQFLCKQPGSPSYLALSMPLVVKLEAVVQAVNDAGYRVPTLHVMSGFRTPAYNASIGNRTVYSRHLWGDAADIFVDVDGDGVMDDLDGDGRTGLGDARLLSKIVDEVEGDHGLHGGVGVYRANAAHGPFVHVDARGQRARW